MQKSRFDIARLVYRVVVTEIAVDRHLATRMITLSTRVVRYSLVRRPLRRISIRATSTIVSRRNCHQEEVCDEHWHGFVLRRHLDPHDEHYHGQHHGRRHRVGHED